MLPSTESLSFEDIQSYVEEKWHGRYGLEVRRSGDYRFSCRGCKIAFAFKPGEYQVKQLSEIIEPRVRRHCTCDPVDKEADMGRARRRGMAATELRVEVPEVVGHHTPLPVRIEPDVEGILEQGPMSFGSAMQAVCQGAEVRRAGWGEDPTVVFLKSGTLTLRGAEGVDKTVVVTEGDLQNDDWVVVPANQSASARLLL